MGMNQINLVRAPSLVQFNNLFTPLQPYLPLPKMQDPVLFLLHYILGTNPLLFSQFCSSLQVYPSLLHRIGALIRMNKLRGMGAAQ